MPVNTFSIIFIFVLLCFCFQFLQLFCLLGCFLFFFLFLLIQMMIFNEFYIVMQITNHLLSFQICRDSPVKDLSLLFFQRLLHLINLILLLNQALLCDKSQILLDPVVFINFLLLKILELTLVDRRILQLFSIANYKLLFFLFALLNVFLLPLLIFTMFLQDFLDLLDLFSFVELFVF